MADEFDDYKDKMKNILKKRKRQSAVRLESDHGLPHHILKILLENLSLDERAYFYTESPLNMKYVFQLLDLIPSAKHEKILYTKFQSYYMSNYSSHSIMDMVKSKDLLLCYPYDDIQTFIDLLKEASEDDSVTSIKITIYRLAKHSKVVEYLCNSAERGKDVTVCIELRARFDEENNINYTNALYQAGCKIIYGFDDYKVHSKICLITYKNPIGEFNYITQIGTGNYNENTSKLYTDFSLITSDRDIGLDASDFFTNMAINNIYGKYEKLLQSPSSLKDKFLKLIDREVEKGSDGFLFFKMNSFTDKDFINKLSEASNNEVKIILIIRGICCLLPGIKGKTENIEVHSIVGRFLEHSRVYQFGKAESADLYISSADLMTRNTERRVEIACPIYDAEIKYQIEKYIEAQYNDNVKGRRMKSNGEYEPVLNNKVPLNSQDYCLQLSREKQLHDAGVSQSDNKASEENAIWDFLKALFGNNK